MITGTPSDFDINGPSSRGIVSLVLPAGNGTTIVMVLSGKPAASAPQPARIAGDNSAASTSAARDIGRCLHDIVGLLTLNLQVCRSSDECKTSASWTIGRRRARS